LQDHYPEQQAKVEYNALSGLIPSMRANRASQRWNEFTGSCVVESIHSSLTDRFSKHASIPDVAHQALLACRGKHYEEMKDGKQKYLPRRPLGTLQCLKIHVWFWLIDETYLY